MAVDVTSSLKAASPYFNRYKEKEEEIKEPLYGDKVPWLKDVHTGQVISTDLDGETRFGVFGPTGSGKTSVIKRLAGVAYQNGFTVAHSSDVKNDFQKVDKYGGIGKKYREALDLLPGEEAFEMPRTLALPNFIVRQHYSGDPSRYGTRFAFGFEDISQDDFMYILGDLTDTQREVLEIVLDRVDFGKSRDELGESHWSKIVRLAKEESGNKSTVLRKLKSKRSKGLIDDNMRTDVLQDLDVEEKGCVSLGLKYYSQYRNGGMYKLRLYSSLFQRQLAEKIQNNEIDIGKGLLLINDEFHILDDAKNDHTFNREFDNILKVAGRQADISTVVASQRPAQVSHPDSGNSYDFLSDLTDVVMLRGKQRISEPDWKTVLRSMGIYRGQTNLQYCRDLFGGLDRYQGVYISSENHDRPEDLQVVEPLCPLIHHPWED